MCFEEYVRHGHHTLMTIMLKVAICNEFGITHDPLAQAPILPKKELPALVVLATRIQV